MPIYNDQALGNNFDPGYPPGLPVSVTVISITLNDANGDGFISPNGTDQVNGSNVTAVWVGDTVTINGVKITGVTFYTADGSRYFTPTGGTVLTPGSATATTFVTTSTQVPVSSLAPPCFVAGTMIATPKGDVPVEELQPGDLVLTQDHGAQPLRWVGQRKVSGRGDFAPILFRAGAIGNARDLMVSPQHRMLLQGWRAELHFGEDEVLCAANRLVNGDSIVATPCDTVTYVHLMFDRHEIVFAEGAASESFLVGEYLCGKDSALREEIIAIFPELDTDPASHIPARPILRGYEASAAAA